MVATIISSVCTILTVIITMAAYGAKSIRNSVTKEDLSAFAKEQADRFDRLEVQYKLLNSRLDSQAEDVADLRERVAVLEYAIKEK